ncbi:MAG: 4Fe-4S cluster-binding domain-containing protein [Lachnospiraceae bacterium]|nr:4Fe-4S cluster-binding domain-containing protein [Lachnospiraceae bacterium]
MAGCPLRCKYCINNEILKAGVYRKMTPEELADAIMIDYCYFYATGGGITFQ